MELEVRNLKVRYGAMLAIDGVSVAARTGRLVALVGANGAGKSTLLKSISGIVRCESGSIRMGGQDLLGLSPHAIARAGIGHVPEGRGLLPGITVAENLRIGAYGRQDRSRVEDDEAMVLKLFPALKERLKQPAGVLSGGEQQMLSLARALMKAPKMLIIDEMSLGLAPKLVQELMDIVVQLVEGGVGALVVEQNTGLILRHAHQAYVLQNGKVVIEGAGPELLADPRLRAAYLGSAKDA